MANQILDDAGWELNGDGIREKDGTGGLLRPLRALGVAAYTSDGEADRRAGAEIGIEFNVQIVSTDKLTELTIRKEDGKPAPEFDTFIWGWGGDPYDPSALSGLYDAIRSARRRTRSTRTPSTTGCSRSSSLAATTRRTSAGN